MPLADAVVTFKRVGAYLRVERSATACTTSPPGASRVGDSSRIRFAIEPVSNARLHAVTHPGHYTKNVVYREVLTGSTETGA